MENHEKHTTGMKKKTGGMKMRGKILQSTYSLSFKHRCFRYNVPPETLYPTTPQKPDERKNQASMSQQEKDRFINAYQTLNSTGELGTLVSYHADMSHMMHGRMGAVGVQRFLPWHRVYLAELEEFLQGINPDIVLPYWDWIVDRNIPDWLQSFTPTVVSNGNPIVVTRTPGLDTPDLPPQQDVDTVMAKTEFTPFTMGLESGRYLGNPEFQSGMHDGVHVWVGGTMGVIDTAPADPIFWMHHANIDRIWSLWQQQNPNKNPTLNGPQATMDPWRVNEEQTRDTLNFGYVYV